MKGLRKLKKNLSHGLPYLDRDLNPARPKYECSALLLRQLARFTLRYIMSCYVMLCYIKLCYAMLCYTRIMLSYITLCHVMLPYVSIICTM
jgi:hypothetical protein